MTLLDDLIDAIVRPAGAAALVASDPGHQASVIALAERERVLPTLGWRLIEEGLVEPIPASLATFLRRSGRSPSGLTLAAVAYQTNRERMLDLSDQLTAIGEGLDGAGISWIPLKGAALLLDEVWPEPLSREMTDLDLLIPDRRRLGDAVEVLRALGYREVTAEEHTAHSVLSDTHQLTAMVREGRAGSVELHRWMMPEEHSAHLPTDPTAAAAIPTPWGLRLAHADMIRHVVAHARISHWSLITAGAELRSILDAGHLLAHGVPDRLVRDTDTPLMARALSAHFSAVAEAFSLTGLPVDAAGRRWWRWTSYVSSDSRRAWLWNQLSLLPVYLRPDRMNARIGGHLSGLDRARATFALVLPRIQQAWRNRPRDSRLP